MENVTIAISFISVASVVIIFFKPNKITNYPSSGETVVMFGDSLIFGKGATEGYSLPELLSKKINMPVINMGIPKQTSADGLARINEIIALNPRVVMVLFGGNDFLQEVPQVDTFKNIRKIVTTLQEYGAVVVLLGIQGGILTDPYKEEFKRVARQLGALHVPSVLENIIGNEDLMSDEVHPNDKGYARIANKIAPVLKKAL